MVSKEIERRTINDDFEKLKLEVQGHKINSEEENALIQRHVKDSKDKCAELIKKFELTVEKMQAKPGQIVGMNKTFVGGNIGNASFGDLTLNKTNSVIPESSSKLPNESSGGDVSPLRMINQDSRDRSPSIKFNRRNTIKMQDIPALLSRKEKFDIYDKKLEEIDELIP